MTSEIINSKFKSISQNNRWYEYYDVDVIGMNFLPLYEVHIDFESIRLELEKMIFVTKEVGNRYIQHEKKYHKNYEWKFI